MTALTIHRLTKSFGTTRVLRGIDLHVPAESFTAILGPSGCGKTTLLRLVAGFDRPDGGTIALDDREVVGPRHWVPAQRRRVGYVPQEGALFPHLDVTANIGFGLPRDHRRAQRRVGELLDLVGLDPAVGPRYPHELSGGQQQRVALARALAPEPTIVLLDEPFSSLDAGLREGTGRAVAQALRAARATAVLVTHDQDEALSLSDQVAVMRAGRLVQVGTPEAVYRTPVDLGVAQFVGAALVVPGTVQGAAVQCALGLLPVQPGAPQGPVTVLVRPEQVVLTTVVDSDGHTARVADVSYYGHDAAVRLDLLPSGPQVLARVLGTHAPARGDVVGLTVSGTATAYG